MMLAEGGLSDLPSEAVLGYWRGPPADWNWRALLQILTKKPPG
jgi:hypothetical protein